MSERPPSQSVVGHKKKKKKPAYFTQEEEEEKGERSVSSFLCVCVNVCTSLIAPQLELLAKERRERSERRGAPAVGTATAHQ